MLILSEKFVTLHTILDDKNVTKSVKPAFSVFQLRSVEVILLLECMFIPLCFIRKTKIIHLGFVIILFVTPLSFIKQIDIFRLGFIRKHNYFLCASKKMSTFAPM
jgi:hypothetical protein